MLNLVEDPSCGAWFVFINRRRTQLKILAYEAGGYCIWAKRLEKGRFALSPSASGKTALTRTALLALYYVILPNLYYRRLREFDIESSSRDEMFERMNSLTNAIVCEDIQALIDFTDSNNAARTGKVGCVGYCMSGPFAFAAAAAFPGRIAAAASFHGVRLFTTDNNSPHLDARKIKGEMYFGCAETDEYAPKAMIDDLQDYLADTDIKYRVEWYPGTEHGFVFPLRRGKYHKASAERHWERILAMYQCYL